MSGLADSSLFDTAVHHLLHLPETLEKLARPHGHRSRGAGAAEDGKGSGGAPVDIIETPKQYTFVFDVPGLSKSDIQVTLEEEKMLVVRSSGKRKRDGEEEEDGECKYLRLERRGTLRFQRKFRLPDDVDPSAISAKCENGVLTLAVGKLPPEPRATKTVQIALA